jgi:carbon monoxide dehydrogenase subunit G
MQDRGNGYLIPCAAVAIAFIADHTSDAQKGRCPMEMTGEFRIPAPRQRVWQGLNDPEVLKQCIPGCQTLEKVSDTEFNGRVVASVGPVRATFGGKVTLSDLDPPQSYTISGEGSGGVAGFARGGAKVSLAEDGAATVLTYAVQAQVGGKLAQVGSRLIDGVARKMANDFFGQFAAVMAPEQPAPAASEATHDEAAPIASTAEPDRGTAEPPLPMPSPRPAGVRLPPAVWVPGLAVIIILLLYFFTR